MNNEQQSLQNWLQKQIKETKTEIKDCEHYSHPGNEKEVWELKYRLSYLESELDNLMYPLD
jgi:hypothetical protein